MNSTVADLTLDDLARRLALELDGAAEASREAQGLAQRLAEACGAPVAALEPLQALDELTQRLSCLSLVLLRLSEQAAGVKLNSYPLFDGIELAALAQRLGAPGAPGSAVVPGEADLF